MDEFLNTWLNAALRVLEREQHDAPINPCRVSVHLKISPAGWSSGSYHPGAISLYPLAWVAQKRYKDGGSLKGITDTWLATVCLKHLAHEWRHHQQQDFESGLPMVAMGKASARRGAALPDDMDVYLADPGEKDARGFADRVHPVLLSVMPDLEEAGHHLRLWCRENLPEACRRYR